MTAGTDSFLVLFWDYGTLGKGSVLSSSLLRHLLCLASGYWIFVILEGWSCFCHAFWQWCHTIRKATIIVCPSLCAPGGAAQRKV
jgi:hypothetical protein